MSLVSATRVLLIRHGETDWNRIRRLQGHTDVPLNAHGQAQADSLRKAFEGESLDAVYSSDLLRALHTAQPVAETTGAPLHVDLGLRERAFGCFEGLRHEEIESLWPEQARHWRQRDPAFGPDGGETLSGFYARSLATAERLAAAHPGGSIALVTHGGVLDTLYRAATRLALDAPRSWPSGNATINRLLHSDTGFTLVGWNDDAHLPAARPGKQTAD